MPNFAFILRTFLERNLQMITNVDIDECAGVGRDDVIVVLVGSSGFAAIIKQQHAAVRTQPCGGPECDGFGRMVLCAFYYEIIHITCYYWTLCVINERFILLFLHNVVYTVVVVVVMQVLL